MMISPFTKTQEDALIKVADENAHLHALIVGEQGHWTEEIQEQFERAERAEKAAYALGVTTKQVWDVLTPMALSS